jgi:hypothetical protein
VRQLFAALDQPLLPTIQDLRRSLFKRLCQRPDGSRFERVAPAQSLNPANQAEHEARVAHRGDRLGSLQPLITGDRRCELPERQQTLFLRTGVDHLRQGAVGEHIRVTRGAERAA